MSERESEESERRGVRRECVRRVRRVRGEE